MTKQLGNSGRGTEEPRPQMSQGEQRKSAGASQGEQLEQDERRAGSPDQQGAGPARPEPDRRAEQPGGGRNSESEKPDSPDSRWGGGG
jgi:hypothetical protein